MHIALLLGFLGFGLGFCFSTAIELRTKKASLIETSKILIDAQIVNIECQISQCSIIHSACQEALKNGDKELLAYNVTKLGAHIEVLNQERNELVKEKNQLN